MSAFKAVAGDQLYLKSVPVAPERSVDLDLHSYDIVTPDAIMTATGSRGAVALPKMSIRLYRGTVAGANQSSVYLAFSDGTVLGSITIDGKEYDIATDYTAPAATGTVAAVSYPRADLPDQLVACGVTRDNIDRLGGASIDMDLKNSVPKLSSSANEILFSVSGAFDGDYEYYKLFNDSVKAAEYMIATIGRVSEVYERELSCQIVISYLNIWTTNTDPYNETQVMDIAVDESRNFWRLNRTNVERGFHEVFSGKPWINPIGIAYLNVLCYKPYGGAFTAITKTNPTRDQMVVAHETGHVFGAKHTHNCSWNPEIDRCAAAEEGSCFGAADIKQSLGTIMSYCSQTEMTFGDRLGPWLKARLNNPVENNSCVEFSRKLTVTPQVIILPQAKLNEPRDTTVAAFFKNEARMPVRITNVEIAGTNMDQFEIIEPNPLPSATNTITLQPGQTQQFKLHYKAGIEAPSQGTMKIYHDGLNQTITVVLEAYAEDRKPDFTFRGISTAALDFKSRKVGDIVDTSFGALYSNFGRAKLHITKTEIVGRDRFDFQIVDGTAPIDIDSAGLHAATVRFAPKSEGQKEAYLRVESNSKDHPVDSLKLIGDVRKGPLLVVKTPGLVVDFGQCERGKPYDTTFAEFFSNVGSDDLALQVSNAEGRDAALFSTTLSGVAELVPGESSAFGAHFEASATEPDGWKQAHIALYNESQDKWDTVHLIARIGNVSGGVQGDGAADASFTIAPNPTGGDATITVAALAGELGREYTLSITDMAGREVQRQGGRFTADGIGYIVRKQMLPAGVYQVTVTTAIGTRTRSLTIAP
jgi:hypothetical protein